MNAINTLVDFVEKERRLTPPRPGLEWSVLSHRWKRSEKGPLHYRYFGNVDQAFSHLESQGAKYEPRTSSTTQYRFKHPKYGTIVVHRSPRPPYQVSTEVVGGE